MRCLVISTRGYTFKDQRRIVRTTGLPMRSFVAKLDT